MSEINKNVRKVDGKGLVMGRPAFTIDQVPQNALVLKVLRSPHAFAKIRQIICQKAMAYPGVVCVLTHQDFPRTIHTRAGQGYPEPSLMTNLSWTSTSGTAGTRWLWSLRSTSELRSKLWD